MVERIAPLRGGIAVKVFEAVNANPDNAQTTVPRLHNFVIDPLSIGRILADQHDGTGFTFHLSGDPFLYGGISTTDHSFPVVIKCWWVTFNRTDLSNLRRPNTVGYIVNGRHPFQ